MTVNNPGTREIGRVLDFQQARVNTAGAYVCFDGLYLFAIGIRPHNGHIPVVRLGGHREEGETGWECAAREVHEESGLEIKPLVPQTTYLSDWDHPEAELQEIQWTCKIGQEPVPLLVVTYCRANSMHLSLMYLARAEGVPKPSSEVRGLVLLDRGEIHLLCREPQTLGQYLQRGGRAILCDTFNMDLVLEPFMQLRLLSRILSNQAGIGIAGPMDRKDHYRG